MVIAVLTSMLLPAFAKGKSRAKAIQCLSNMRNWGHATALYLADFDDKLPLFGDVSTNSSTSFWHGKLAPYLSRPSSSSDMYYGKINIFRDVIRRCPGGKFGPPPFSTSTNELLAGWNCWIGANFGAPERPLSAPFYYGDKGTPVPATCIKKPDHAMLYMDSFWHGQYTPVQERYRFVLDMDGDGAADSMAAYTDVPYNFARPTVHNNGANVTSLDGHVERIAFKNLWNVDSQNKVTHPMWYLND